MLTPPEEGVVRLLEERHAIYVRTRDTGYNGYGSLAETLGIARGARDALVALTTSDEAKAITTRYPDLESTLTTMPQGRPPGEIGDLDKPQWSVGYFGGPVDELFDKPLDELGLNSEELKIAQLLQAGLGDYEQRRRGSDGRERNGPLVERLNRLRGIKYAFDQIKTSEAAGWVSQRYQTQLY